MLFFNVFKLIFLRRSSEEVRSQEVAVAELNGLSSSRVVYQKNGNIFFRTTIQKATAFEQKQLDATKAELILMWSNPCT
ncbi:hypothetical protein AAHA92_28591 [Salvia divinorum]|uniref:Uncharacterized protein n=1 Tax=Salvia divinorum TaxID=28513 RepID=A0ABD1FYR5_SALDI